MKIPVALKRILIGLLALIALTATVIAIETLGGQPMGLFSGSRPDGLGFNDGRFKQPSWKPNCVSSTVGKSDAHYIEPIAFSGAADAAWSKLAALVKSQPRVTAVGEKPNYLYAEFKSATMGYVDDVEFAMDGKANVIHVRSASRLGVRDFNVNRNRIESLRTAFAR